jgi:hypothetical protein
MQKRKISFTFFQHPVHIQVSPFTFAALRKQIDSVFHDKQPDVTASESGFRGYEKQPSFVRSIYDQFIHHLSFLKRKNHGSSGTL